MRFKSYYLQETLLQRNIDELRNIISGISEKDIPKEVKMENGVGFFITNLGAWSTFKDKLIKVLTEKKWKDYSTDPKIINLKNKDMSLFVEYKNNNAEFFLTDDLKYIPGEEQ